jgi:hypothetical protein
MGEENFGRDNGNGINWLGEVDGSGRKADFSTTLFTKSVNSFGRNDVLRAEVFRAENSVGKRTSSNKSKDKMRGFFA